MLGWRKRREEEALKLFSALKKSENVPWILLPPSGTQDEAIFQIRESEPDAFAAVELNAHIELCRKRHYKVTIKQVTQEIPSECIGTVEYYHKGILELRLHLKKPIVDFAKTI